MTLDSVDLIPVITALAGALVGGLVSGLGALLGGARERRRALRSILFELLELRHQVGRRDPERLLATLGDALASRGGKDAAAMLATPAGQQFARQIVEAAAKAFSEGPLGPDYDSAVRTLAPHDPFLAYRLHGKARFLQIDQAVATYFDAMLAMPAIALGPSSAGMRGATELATTSALRRDAREQLSGDIHRVALALSPIAYVRARRTLSRQNVPGRREMREWIDELIARLPPGTFPPRAS